MANGLGNALRVTTGQMSWASGVNSNVVSTIASPENPNGLKPDQLSWANSATMRGGSISPRSGWLQLVAFAQGIGILQEAYMYQPRFAFPYIVAQIAGRTFLARVDLDPVVITEVTIAGDPNPATIDQNWMVQGEEFLIIQDGVSEPLVWDGTVLRRISAMGGTPPFLRTGEAMTYYQGHIWVAFGREYWAGDVVGGPSGTLVYGLRDSILHMVENTFTSLGGSFTVPTTAGNIRALNYPANINTILGQGQLLIFTREQIYSADVPIKRSDWAGANGTSFTQKVAQINFGTTSDRSVVHVNGDIFCQSSDPGVRSVTAAVRNFDTWGDLPISIEEARALNQTDRALLRFGCGVYTNNRLLETTLPYQTDVGVAHKGILPLNFDLVSTLAEKKAPAWEGILEGLPHLRLLKGDFGGRERAFSIARGTMPDGTGRIECWELTDFSQEDSGTHGPTRIQWAFETPSFTWNQPFQLKQLDTIELWIDRLYGDVEFTVQFRPDQHPCWEDWWKFKQCAPRNNCEDLGVLLPDECYPVQRYREQYRATLILPKPPSRCEFTQARPIDLGYAFQFRIFVKGFCRIRGLMVHGFPKEKQPYLGITPC